MGGFPVGRGFRSVLALIVMTGSSAVANAAGANVDPMASKTLHAMCDYMKGIKSFTVEATSTIEIVTNGQKLDFEALSQVTVMRPNRVRWHRVGVLDESDFYYDGKQVSVYMQNANYYATDAAPDTLDGAMDFVHNRLDIKLPGADLLRGDCYDRIAGDASEGTYLGTESVGGLSVHHLAFRASKADSQVWIQTGDKPLPLKYLITNKSAAAWPELGVSLRDWNLSPNVDAKAFEFTPPAGARKVEFVKFGATK